LYNHESGTILKSSKYESCQRYAISEENQCDKTNVVYKLVDCVKGYHAVGDHCEENIKILECYFYSSLQKPLHSHWVRESGNYRDYLRYDVFGSIYLDG
jgi:hypothetical protein